MNSKGFTLIELLVVIVIIGVVGTTATVGAQRILEIKMEKEYTNFKSVIENAACVMVDLSKFKNEVITVDGKTLDECKSDSRCLIGTDILVQEGLANRYFENPKTKESIENHNYYVEVRWIDGLKQCKINE